MSIPKYAFQVEVYSHTGSLYGSPKRQTHNYETLDGAYAFSASAMRRFNTYRVRVLCVLDDREVKHGKDNQSPS